MNARDELEPFEFSQDESGLAERIRSSLSERKRSMLTATQRALQELEDATAVALEEML